MRSRVRVSAGIYLTLAVALLLLPLRWVMAWLLAVTIHETGHYVALRLCKIPIFAIEISPLGVTMHTGDLQGKETVFCALAGPFFALLFTALSSVLPCTAVCILFQSLYNLLPVCPLDGGRALRAILCRLLPSPWVGYIESGILCLTALVFLYLFYFFRLGIVPALLTGVIFAQKFLANRDKTGYNRGKKRF